MNDFEKLRDGVRRIEIEEFTKLTVEEFKKICENIVFPTNWITFNYNLKKSNSILRYMLEKDLMAFKYFDVEAFDDEVISSLEATDYIPDYEDFKKCSMLKQHDKFLMKGFKRDPRIIVFFNRDLTFKYAEDAVKRGFIASFDDLMVKNKNLRDSKFIMEAAIENQPSLIVCTGAQCRLNDEVVETALKKYEITKASLLTYPDLRKNKTIMKHLPELELYDASLSEESKIKAIVRCLRNNIDINTNNLPFLDEINYGNSQMIDSALARIIPSFKILIDEDDIKVQQKYFEMLDRIIDGIISIRYKRNKPNFQYKDIVQLNEYVISSFQKRLYYNDSSYTENLILELYNFVNQSKPKEEIEEAINSFYSIYKDERNS